MNSGKFTEYMKNLNWAGAVKGIGVGIGVAAVTSFIGKMAHLTREGQDKLDFWVTEGLAGTQLALEITSLAAGEGGPVGLVVSAGAFLALPVAKLYGWLQKPERYRKQDDKPESVYGSMFSWVREWSPEQKKYMWYPGILGAYDPRTYGPSVRVNYGKLENLRWRLNTDGTYSPYFKGPLRVKIFNMREDQFGKKKVVADHYIKFVVILVLEEKLL